MKPWDPVEIRPGHYLHYRVGSLQLWLFPDKEEWYGASIRLPEDPQRDDSLRVELVKESPEGLDWQRWVANGKSRTARLTPMLPDRPIVVRSASPLKMAMDSTAHYFIAIPAWVQVSVGEPQRTDLWQEPAQILSNTWFGDPASGELCYALRTGLHSGAVGGDFLPYTVVCPITIRNTSSAILEFQRLCVHVEYLDIFPGRTYLWANGVRVSFKGEEQFSQVDIEERPPEIDQPGPVLSQARRREDRSLIRRSFSMLKFFSGF